MQRQSFSRAFPTAKVEKANKNKQKMIIFRLSTMVGRATKSAHAQATIVRVILGVITLLLLSTHNGATAFVSQSPNALRNYNYKLQGSLLILLSESNNESDEYDSSSSLTDPNRRRLFRESLSAVAVTAISLIPSSATAKPTTTTAVNYLVPTPPFTKQEYWPLGKVAFSLLPLAGTSTSRATVEECIVPNTIWTHDQIQGIVNVNVPVRQTVVKLSTGGLFVHNPVAPTPQLLNMMQQLIDQHGPVRHIVLGTVALEHKATFGAFSANYPNATVWIQPGQWSFPAGVPIEFYGLPQRGPRLREIPVPGRPATKPQYQYQAARKPVPEWAEANADFEYQVLGPFSFRSVGGFSETAFFHKPTKTLIVTDTVVSVTADAPPIIQQDPRALLYHARDSASENILQDTVQVRQKGWRRMVQFGLVFFPSAIQVTTPFIPQTLRDAQLVPQQLRNLGDGAIPGGTVYPWSWPGGDSDQRNFDAISAEGRLFCPPILTKLILDREPAATLAWVDIIAQRWPDMVRVIPCHLNNNVRVANSREFYQAFEPLRSRPGNLRPQRALGEDLALLQQASDLLTAVGVVAPSLVCDGEAARQRGRFAR
jgi:hypothetical protein